MEVWDRLRQRLTGPIEVGTDRVPLASIPRKQIHPGALLSDVGLLLAGAVVLALGVDLFIAPYNIAPGGASGLSIILNSFLGWPLGLTMLAINLPAFLLGYRHLGGNSFLARSMLGTVTYNVAVDLLNLVLPANRPTDVMILNAIFGGVIMGFGAGLIYRAGGTAGAGGILSLLLRKWKGWPIKVGTVVANFAIIGLAGLVFGWEAALYALIAFYVSGAASDFTLEGPAVIRTALIITDHAEPVAESLTHELGRGVTQWRVIGAHRNEEHTALYCTVTRPQIARLKDLVARSDPEAFVIIAQGREALGEGFEPLKEEQPAVSDVAREGDIGD